jgi:hypothetical protein
MRLLHGYAAGLGSQYSVSEQLLIWDGEPQERDVAIAGEQSGGGVGPGIELELEGPARVLAAEDAYPGGVRARRHSRADERRLTLDPAGAGGWWSV